MTSPNRPRPTPSQPGRGSGGGTYAQMQRVLDSQEAANEATRQAMQAMQVAMNGMLNSMDSMINPAHAPGYGAGPHGGRPSMPGNQTRRPVAGSYSTSDYDPYSSAGNGRGMGGVRGNIARNLNSQYGAPSGPRYESVYDQQGNHVGYNEFDKNGNHTMSHTAQWGQSQEGRSALAGAARRQVASRALGGMAEGGAIGAARAVPYVGAAIMGAEAIHEGLTFVSNQRAQNAQYQSIYGGSNFSQFGQRAEGFGYGLKNLFGGGLTWGQSQEAFRGVSALGYKGSQRSSDLDFVNQNYMKMGVSVADSLKLITTASQDLNESLTGLQSGLKGTRDAARATGQSGAVGTQIYSQNYASLGSQYSDLNNGVTVANNILSPMQASLGRYGSSINYTKMLTDPAQAQIMASHLGVSVTQFTGMLQSGDPKLQRRVMSGIDFNLARATAPTLQNQGLQKFINQQLKSVTGMSGLTLSDAGKYLTPSNNAQISQNILEHADQFGLNAKTLQAQFASAGLTGLTQQQAIMQLLSVGSGRTSAAAQVGPVGTHAASARHFVQHGHGGAWAYDYTRSGVNPALDAAKSKLKGDRVEVTVNGKKRVVDINTAIKYYPDQIAKGQAIVEGTGGKTVASMTGTTQRSVLVDPSAATGKDGPAGNVDTTHSDKTGGGGKDKDDLKKRQGMSVSAYTKLQAKEAADKAKNDAKHTVGKVVIEPSAELKSLLNFSYSGNVGAATAAAAAGDVPVPGS